MKIETKFDMHQKVFIAANSFQACQIDKIILEGKNLFYGIFYWLNGELKTLNIEEGELVATIPESAPGFKP